MGELYPSTVEGTDNMGAEAGVIGAVEVLIGAVAANEYVGRVDTDVSAGIGGGVGIAIAGVGGAISEVGIAIAGVGIGRLDGRLDFLFIIFTL